jgi:hypothetical protein
MGRSLAELVTYLDNNCCSIGELDTLREILNQSTRILLEEQESNESLEDILEGISKLSGFWIPECDYFAVAYPTSVQEIYTFKDGGVGGTTVAIVTLNYTDATKEFLSDGSIVRP